MMNVSLTPELEAFVNEKVGTGLYQTASEVIREGLRMLKEREQIRDVRLAELRNDVDIGIQQADRGETEILDISAIKTAGRKRLAKRGRHAKGKA